MSTECWAWNSSCALLVQVSAKQFKHWSKQVSRIHYSHSVGLLHFKPIRLEFIWLDSILHYTNRATLPYKRISSAITPLMSLQSGAINLSLLEKDLLRLSSSRRKKEITFHWITILVPLVSHFSSWQFIWAENEANEKEWKSNQISNGQLHYYEVQGLAIRSFAISCYPQNECANPITLTRVFTFSPLHIVSFDWFLSSLEGILDFEFCLLIFLIFYQKLLWNIRSRLNCSTFWVFESVFK